MNEAINLPSILISNTIAIFMMLMVLFNASWRVKGKGFESNITLWLISMTMLLCVADPIVFYCDGKPGTAPYLGVFLGNTVMYLGTLINGPLWLLLITYHMESKVSKLRRYTLIVTISLGLIMLIINYFYPIVFSVDEDNVYKREALYYYYVAINFLFIADALITYLVSKRKGGALKLFPVLQFAIPIAIGIVIQSLAYGVSIIWPASAVSVCGVLMALQNETSMRDNLTGLYNRFFLESISKSEESKNAQYAFMMLDMNGFKQINDNFGHEEGDKALIAMAEILSKVVGRFGTVIRYAGDEFFILLNTRNANIVEKTRNDLAEELNRYNAGSGKPYMLDVSIGVTTVDFEKDNPDLMFKTVDKLMYEDKKKFYENNKQYERRQI